MTINFLKFWGSAYYMKANLEEKSKVESLLHRAHEQRVSDLQESVKLAEKALAKSRKLDDPSLIGKSLSKLALFHMIHGKNSLSLKMSEEAILHFTELKDELGIADAKYSIAGIYYKTNNFHLGMFYLIDCLRIYRKFQDKYNESRTQKSLGAVYEILGDQANAIKAYKGAIEAAIVTNNGNLESNAYNPLSGILLKINKSEDALEMIQRSISIKKETGDVRGMAFALYGRGKVWLHLKKYEDAKNDFLAALEIHESVGEHLGTGMANYKISKLWVAMGKRAEAIDLLEKTLLYSDEHKISLIKTKCTYLLYQIYKEDRNELKSLIYLEKYLKEKEEGNDSQTLKVIENYELISQMRAMEQEASINREKREMIIRQEQVEQSARMKQEFLSAMSHEIRTPLNAVTSIISLLQDRSTEEEKQLLTSLRFSSKNLLRIINDILDFSKLDSNKMSLEEHPAQFIEVLNNIRQTYVGLAMEKGLQLNVHIAEDLGESYSLDETKLFQILGNLVSNAIKFTEKGSVDMRVKLLESTPKFDVVQFKVEDTGIGIPKSEQLRLFESFYMPTSITTRSDGGTGLGLAIVKKLVELHDSDIHIDSAEGQGASFYFNLKLKKSKAPIKVDIKLFEKLRDKTAILAEDNEINAMVMIQLLEKWGMKVSRVKNGAEAVELALTETVDFVLMDIHMPIMNGYDATRKIRAKNNPNSTTPIFALTADITAVNNSEHDKLFDGFLSKPLQIERLFESLVNAYDKEHTV